MKQSERCNEKGSEKHLDILSAFHRIHITVRLKMKRLPNIGKERTCKRTIKKTLFFVFSIRRYIIGKYIEKKDKNHHTCDNFCWTTTFVIENGVINDRTINEGLVRVFVHRSLFFFLFFVFLSLGLGAKHAKSCLFIFR